MTNEEKVAISRIMNDIIKADGQLSVEQFAIGKEMLEQYHFNLDVVSQSRQVTFSDSLKALRHLSRLEKKELLGRMYTLAFANNMCTKNEALLLSALEYSLNKGIVTISVPTVDRQMPEEITITYMESDYHEEHNDELLSPNRYRLIDRTCQMESIRFAYVPHIMSEFVKLDSTMVGHILRYMSPSLTDEEALSVSRRMGEVTTSEFYLKMMHLPMQNVINPPTEFLLVPVGISMTPYCQADGPVKYFKDYMLLPIENTVLETIDFFLRTYKSYLTIPPVLRPTNDSFYDFTFYKQFFDFLLTPPPVKPDLIFLGQEPKSGKYQIAFRFGSNEKRVNLSPKEYDAFYEIVDKTYHSKTKGMPIGYDRTNLAPVISHIRQKITSELPELALAERFKPERSGNVYTVHLEDTKVFVRKYRGVKEWDEVPF